MKKRLFAVACTIVVVMSLCACKNIGKTSTTETSVSTVSQTKSDTVTSTSKDENSPKIELDEVDFKRGLLNNQKYTNDTLDLTITLDDTWTIANEDQLASLNGMTTETLHNMDMDQFTSATNLIDFYAANQAGSTLNLAVQKLPAQEYIAVLLNGEEAYVKANYDYLVNNNIFDSLLGNQGVTNINVSMESYDFCGEKHWGMLITGEYNMGDRVVPYTIRQVLYRTHNYFVTITYSGSYDADDLSFLDYFSKEK